MSNNSDSDSGAGERHSIASRNGRRKRTAEPDSDDQSTRRQRRRRHSPQPDPQDDDDNDDDDDNGDVDDNDDDDQDNDSDDGDDDDDDDDNNNNGNGNDDEYDPDQPLEERRRVQRALRDQQKQMRENPDEYLQEDPAALLAYFAESALTFRNVKQTAEAAIDSRGLVIAADLSARRVQRLTAGMGAGNGIDVDEFVSKCITYMLHRGGSDNDAPLSGTQRRRDPARQQTGRNGRGAIGSEDEDEDEDEEDGGGGGDGDGDEDGDMRDWSHLGRHACVPSVRRPAVPGFLLGPLSVEKKVRKITKRTAPLRLNQLEEVRPQELRAEDLKKSEAGNVPNVCKKIYEILNREYRARMDKFEQDWDEDLAEDSPENLRVFERHALRQDGGLCLIRFVVNPKSFGQTVENLFYTSFLIKDRRIKLSYDVDGLPSITPVSEEDRGDDNARKKEVRHQAIMSLDMAVWRDMIDVFHITTPIIPHRREEPQEGPGERGWY